MHTSLDGFVAGPNGEMNWICVDDEIFENVEQRIKKTDTALYGRVTYQMMEAYWPTAAEKPGASRHDLEHSAWYKNAHKIVLSNTLDGAGLDNTLVLGKNDFDRIRAIKDQPGSDILVFGSPSAAHALMAAGLIDGYWLFVNPILLGTGIPLFKGITEHTKLTLLESKTFSSGVNSLYYEKLV